MLKHDGFSRIQRLQMMRKGLPWFFGKKGILSRMRGQYLDWFKNPNGAFSPDGTVSLSKILWL
jgi:predicted metal-dependent hydrolase